MTIAAVYNVWDGIELLRYSVKNIKPLVDAVYIVWSRRSNRGEDSDEFNPEDFKDCVLIQSEPAYRNNPSESEREKRNVGLNAVRNAGFTHFIMMDCDEFYDPKDFKREKKRIEKHDLNGLVCDVTVFFAKPTLSIGKDPSTFVPFIQKITPRLKYRMNKGYPFAYDSNGGLRIDPTRHLNVSHGVEWSDITMYHYSWVRKDLQKKARNSSARLNNSRWADDIANAAPGYFCQLYQRMLFEVDNKFNIEI